MICKYCKNKITGIPRKHFKGDYSCYRTKDGRGFTICYRKNCESYMKKEVEKYFAERYRANKKYREKLFSSS